MGATVGGLEVVWNWKSGEVSGFAFGGAVGGWSGVWNADVSAGLIYGLGASNEQYSGMSYLGSAGPPGLWGRYASMSQDYSIIAAGPTVGVNMTGGVTMAGGAVGYTKPLPFGKFTDNLHLGSVVDYFMYGVHQICNAVTS